jgi:hypothetical protein
MRRKFIYLSTGSITMSNRFWEKKKNKPTREINHRKPRKRILIVCEGEKTEKKYFESFHVTSAVVVDIIGEGYNTDSLIEQALSLYNEAISNDQKYDQVWCVFDRDSFPPDNFKRAIDLAYRYKFKVAYTNEAFELWFLLHFNYYDTGISREQYKKKLDNLLGHKYKKNSNSMYDELIDKQQKAIINAKRLLNKYDTLDPEQNNPSTTVHLLVEELNKNLNNKC